MISPSTGKALSADGSIPALAGAAAKRNADVDSLVKNKRLGEWMRELPSFAWLIVLVDRAERLDPGVVDVDITLAVGFTH